MTFIELSHTLGGEMSYLPPIHGTTGARQVGYTARPFVSHADSLPHYEGKASFEISEVCLQGSVGTYIDAPGHRFPGADDVCGYGLEDLILPAWVVVAEGCGPGDEVHLEELALPSELAEHAVLLRFGWDRHWARDGYRDHPFLAPDAVMELIEAGVRLVGVDTQNVDSPKEPARPAHTALLSRRIPVVENLTGLGRLPVSKPFRFYALPIRASGAYSFPVRAFAETTGSTTRPTTATTRP